MKIIYFSVLLVLMSGCKPVKQEHNVYLNLEAILNTISYDQEKIIYSCWDTTVCIYSLEKKSKIFSIKAKDICYARPIVKMGKLYFPFSDDKFICVDLKSNTVLWELALKGRCGNFDFVNDTTIIASCKNSGLIALGSEKGNVLYTVNYDYDKTKLPDLSPWSVAYDSSSFYVSNWQGSTLSSFRKKDGSLNWEFTDDQIGTAGKVVLFGDKMFVGINRGYKDGQLALMDTDGKLLKSKRYKYEERSEPIVHNGCIYFYSYDGLLNKYNLINDRVDTILTFKKPFDLSGNQMYLFEEDIFFSDASFFVNRYSTVNNINIQVTRIERPILGVSGYKGVLYFIN